MFRKLPKNRLFPPGTFIATPVRIMAILQLCIALTVLLANLGSPFLQELFDIKEKELLFEAVQNSPYYSTLDEAEKGGVERAHSALMDKKRRPLLRKSGDSIRRLFVHMPPFKLAWLILSLIVPVMLLKKREGAKQALWLLPLVTLCYTLDNQIFYKNPPASREEALFPTEAALVKSYLKNALPPSLEEQKSALKRAFELYLIDNWSRDNRPKAEAPSGGIERASLAFNIARIEAKIADEINSPPYEWRQHPILLAIYLLWNLTLALSATLFLKEGKMAEGGAAV